MMQEARPHTGYIFFHMHNEIFQSLLRKARNSHLEWRSGDPSGGIRKRWLWTSLVAQWIRICLPVQGTQVWFLVQKIPRAADHPSPWVTTIEHVLWSLWAAPADAQASSGHTPQLEKPPQWEACALQLERSPCSPQREKACSQHRRPRATKK